jgi:DNA-binding beta-propeller fold protein YncE
VATATTPHGIVVDPTGRFVYIGMESDTQGLAGYSIDQASGALSPLPGYPMAVGSHPANLVMDRTGSFLFTANATGEDVTSIKIDPVSGAATVVGSVHVGATMLSAPSAIAVHPSGTMLYVTSASEDDITSYLIDANGNLAIAQGLSVLVPTGPGPTAIAIEPGGEFMVVADDNEVRSYIASSLGNPAVDSTAPTSGVQSVGLAVGDDDIVYVIDMMSDTANAFGLAPGGGGLSLLGANCGGPFRTGSRPIAIAVWGNYH